jgi:hypothetical protein
MSTSVAFLPTALRGGPSYAAATRLGLNWFYRVPALTEKMDSAESIRGTASGSPPELDDSPAIAFGWFARG